MLEDALKKILLSRFEPLETLTVIHQLVIGALLIAPGNENLFILVEEPLIKVGLGVTMVLFSVVHLVCLWFKDWPGGYRCRKTGTMFTFVSYLFLTFAKIQTVGPVARFDWTAFLFVALTAAIMNLSLWYKRLAE